MTDEPTVPADDDTVDAPEPARQSSPRTLHEGDRVGRFTVLHTLGHGGMGIVLAAMDDDLDRTVAIKIVRPTGEGNNSQRSRERLLREARAMARVSHPNVITVHEVGTFGDDVFLAMEHIDGGTLAQWANEHDRSWSTIVEAWLSAGRGLEAAHKAGLVHRDFKPANVLVSRDGRIVVTDFGLAGQVGQLELGTADRTDTIGSMTRTGAVMGTPLYMAPEQHAALSVDARADQFAFCVSLWEAVYGEHPFGDGSAISMVARIVDGRLRPPPPSSRVPAALRRIVTRGLAPDPRDRYDSMGSLLAELERLLSAGRRRRWVAGATLVLGAVLTAGFLSGRGLERTANELSCDEARGDWTGVWDASMRERVRSVFDTADDRGVRLSWEPFEAALDQYVARVDAAHVAVCESASKPGADPVAVEIRQRCLRRARATVGALTTMLAEHDAAVLGNALESAGALPAPHECERELGELGAKHVPPELEQAVGTLEDATDRARLLAVAGRAEAAIELLEPLRAHADAIEHTATRGSFHAALATAYTDIDVPKARMELQRAYVLATEAGAADDAIHAATDLATLAASPESARFWHDVADALSKRLGLPEAWKQTMSRALAAREHGDVKEAERWFRRALEVAESARERASAHGNLGGFYLEQRQFDEAREHLEVAIERSAEYFGPSHRRTLSWKVNAVALDVMAGEYARGLTTATALLEAQQATMSPDHEELAVTHALMGFALRGLGRYAEALPHDEEALRIRRKVYGDRQLQTLQSMAAVAADASQLGQHERAIKLASTLIESTRATLADRPLDAAEYLFRAARVQVDGGLVREPVAVLQELLDAVDDDASTEHVGNAAALLGHLLLRERKTEAAARYLRRAEAVSNERGQLPSSVAEQLARDLAKLEASP